MSDLHLTVSQFLCAELVGAAALALWLVARFPNRGPRSLRTAGAAMAAAVVALQLAPFGLRLAVDAPLGAYVGLFAVVLPSFVGAFLAAAWLMRLLAAAVGGSGGGGHPLANES